MACRDCAWWDLKSAKWRLPRLTPRDRKKGLDGVWSLCLFPDSKLPVWVITEIDQGELNGMLGREGTDCPAFKAREDTP